MSLYGRVIGDPFNDYAGGTATADVAIGDTVIPVDDVSDFDEDAAVNGGILIVGVEIDDDGLVDETNATRLPYSTFDEDAGTVTLTSPSPVAIDSGDFLYVLDDVADEPLVDVTVWVEVDGADPDGDPLPALVAHELIAAVIGTDDVEGLPVVLEVDEDDQLVARPVGGSKAGKGGKDNTVRFMQDQVEVTDFGDQLLRLTYRPIENSEHVYLGGVYQEGDQWTRDGWDLTLQDPDHIAQPGYLLVCEYAYLDPTTRPIVPASLELLGVSQRATENAPFLDVPVPEESEPGALLVFSGSSYAPNGEYTLDFDGDGFIDDPRIKHFEFSLNNPPGINGSFPGGVYCAGWAIDDGSGDPLKIGQGGIADDILVVAAFRFTGQLAAHWQGKTDAAPDNVFAPDNPPGDPPIVIGCLQGQRGTVSNGFTVDPDGPWVVVADVGDAHLALARAHIAYSPVGGLGVWEGLSNPSVWSALTIGVYDDA